MVYEVSYEFPLGSGKIVRRNVNANNEDHARYVAGVNNPTLKISEQLVFDSDVTSASSEELTPEERDFRKNENWLRTSRWAPLARFVGELLSPTEPKQAGSAAFSAYANDAARAAGIPGASLPRERTSTISTFPGRFVKAGLARKVQGGYVRTEKPWLD